MADINQLLAEINQLATAPAVSDAPLAFNQIAGASQSSAPLTPFEKILGYSRSYLAGPTFNYADQLEALASSLFGPETYNQELATIRDQQARFKDKTDYLDNAVEIASGALLNPLDKLKKVKMLAEIPLVSTLSKIVTSAPGQAAIASAGAADGENVLGEAAKGAVFGSALSAVGSVLGNVLEDTAKSADRFKLSAYKIGAADLNKSLRKLGESVDDVADASDLPIVQSLASAEREGLVSAAKSPLENASSVAKAQDAIMGKLLPILDDADAALPPQPAFRLDNVTKYIMGLSGTARIKAKEAAEAEVNTLLSQMGQGTLRELQDAKVGLNYRFDGNPYAQDIITALRSDLRSEIERRVDSAAAAGILPGELAGSVKSLNSKWGELADLKQAFRRSGAKDLLGNPIEDAFAANATTRGAGSANIMSAQTGNPIYAVIGAGLNAARAPEALNAAADVLRDPAIGKPIEAIGRALPEVLTGRNVAQARAGLSDGPKEEVKQPENSATQLLKEIQKLGGAKAQRGDTAIDSLFSKGKNMDDIKQPIAYIEQQIDSDPYMSALYEVESSRGKKLTNDESSAKGAFQLIDATAKALGVTDPMDIAQNYAGAKKLTDGYRIKYGNDPEMLYAAHFLGETVLDKLLAGKDLTDKQAQTVTDFKKLALPRFQRIYKEVLKKQNSDIKEA